MDEKLLHAIGRLGDTSRISSSPSSQYGCIPGFSLQSNVARAALKLQALGFKAYFYLLFLGFWEVRRRAGFYEDSRREYSGSERVRECGGGISSLEIFRVAMWPRSHIKIQDSRKWETLDWESVGHRSFLGDANPDSMRIRIPDFRPILRKTGVNT